MPADRTLAITSFLQNAGHQGAKLTPLAGDASARRYFRVTGGPGLPGVKTAVLMDAPPESGTQTGQFTKIAKLLHGLGFSAPKILASDHARGFLLIEDLGDDLFSRVAAQNPELETMIYMSAVDVLIALHRHPAPTYCPRYDAPTMAENTGVAYDYYAAGVHGRIARERKALAVSELGAVLAAYSADQPVLVLRDYHSENLLWLPDRKGVGRVGLLDFQDTVIGHPATDLVSLTQDARRDVSPELAERAMEHFIARTQHNPKHFRAAAAAVSAQRNLRILGVFARLSLHFGKPSYVDFIPRVWDHLMRDLAHPSLAHLKGILLEDLPAPTSQTLTTLKEKCGTILTPL